MESRLKEQHLREWGFTLIELVLVIILIVILTLIAIPMYLSQRGKGWDANVESDLHNAGIAQQTYYHDHNSFSNNVDDLLDAGYSQSSHVSLNIDSADDEQFCIEAYYNSNPSRVWHVDNGAGTPVPRLGSCP